MNRSTGIFPTDPDCMRISVLSPFGRALIGARVGDIIKDSDRVVVASWWTASGREA